MNAMTAIASPDEPSLDPADACGLLVSTEQRHHVALARRSAERDEDAIPPHDGKRPPERTLGPRVRTVLPGTLREDIRPTRRRRRIGTGTPVSQPRCATHASAPTPARLIVTTPMPTADAGAGPQWCNTTCGSPAWTPPAGDRPSVSAKAPRTARARALRASREASGGRARCTTPRRQDSDASPSSMASRTNDRGSPRITLRRARNTPVEGEEAAEHVASAATPASAAAISRRVATTGSGAGKQRKIPVATPSARMP